METNATITLRRCELIFIGIIACICYAAPGATKNWVGQTTLWGASGNWSSPGVPGSNDDVNVQSDNTDKSPCINDGVHYQCNSLSIFHSKCMNQYYGYLRVYCSVGLNSNGSYVLSGPQAWLEVDYNDPQLTRKCTLSIEQN